MADAADEQQEGRDEGSLRGEEALRARAHAAEYSIGVGAARCARLSGALDCGTLGRHAPDHVVPAPVGRAAREPDTHAPDGSEIRLLATEIHGATRGEPVRGAAFGPARSRAPCVTARSRRSGT